MIFNTKESKAALTAINNKTNLNFEDSSHINEGADSCTIQLNDIVVFVGFPNVYGRTVNNESESSFFIVRLFQLSTGESVELTWHEGKEDETSCLTLEQAIETINTYIATKNLAK